MHWNGPTSPDQASIRLCDLLDGTPDQHVDEFGFESHHETVRSRLPTGTVTFLFTDIEDSTSLLQGLGDTYSGLLDRHAAIVRRALAGNKGLEVGVEGDAFFAVFTSAEEALSAAVEAQRGLADEPWPEDRRVRIRMGLHTGQGKLGGDGYVGLDVHRAARIASAAHGGQVLLSAATKELVAAAVPPRVGLRDLGLHRLRGIDQLEHIYQLVIDGLSVDFPPIRTIDARQTNVPPQRTSFVGRERDVAEVTELVRRARMVTLTGPGGIGKTRLALTVAINELDHFEDGVYLSDLSPIRDASLVPETIATALLLPEQPGRAAIDVLIHHLRDRHLLLVLDNFEQVAEAAPMVGRLLDDALRLSVLATSRTPLHLSGEQEFPMSPLTLPDAERLDLDDLSRIDALQLFVERAAAIRPGFRLTPENARAIAQITVRLDGLPLAIELAAGRIRLFSPDAILARLDARMDLLQGGPKDVPARQQTLRAAIEWSHDLLRASEQSLFGRLAAFSGGWTLDAAQAVCGPGLSMPVIDGLTLLVDHSLVRLAEDDVDEPRFAMLETIREYAAERLTASGERDEVRRRHADYYRALAEEARPQHVEPNASSARRLDRERDNVRAALAWALDAGQAEIGLQIGAAVWALWPRRDLAAGRIWLERLLALPNAQRRNDFRARALASLAGIYLWQNQLTLGRAAAQEAIDIARELRDDSLLAHATSPLAVLLQAAGEFDLEEAALREAMDSAEAAGHRLSALELRARIGYLQVFRGNPAAAIAPLREAIAAQSAAGLTSHVVWNYVSLGAAEMLSGDLDSATRHFRDVLAMSKDTGDLVALGAGVSGLAFVASRQGRHEAMARLWGFAARLRGEAGGGPAMSILRLLGDPVGDARRALGDEAFERLRADGEAMDIQETVAYATMDMEDANV